MLTPKERSKVYRKAAELVGVQTDSGCCYAIRSAKRRLDVSEPFYHYELLLFQPDINEDWIYWWKIEDRQPRILALLFASEMCKDK